MSGERMVKRMPAHRSPPSACVSSRTAISPAGLVTALQTLDVQCASFRPLPGTARAWLEDYCVFVRSFTYGLISTPRRRAGLDYTLLGSRLAALRFGAPALLDSEGLVCWALPITGGVLAAQPGGYLATAAQALPEGQWRLTMLLNGYAPRLAALWPAGPWRWTYLHTQALIHQFIAQRYLQRLLSLTTMGRCVP